MKDNRNYRYKLNENSFRAEYGIISGWIPANSNVLDLGCGDGSLLKLLGGKGINCQNINPLINTPLGNFFHLVITPPVAF